MRQFLLAFAALATCASAGAQTPAAPKPTVVTPRPVAVSPRPMTSIDAAGLVAAFQHSGFTAESHVANGETLVFARRGPSSFQATLSHCTGVRCTEIELFVAFDGRHIAWERINGWNARTRFARAFLDEKRTPSLQMDLSLDGGVTQAGLEASLKTWGASVDTFALFLATPATPAARAAPPQSDPAPLTLPSQQPGAVHP